MVDHRLRDGRGAFSFYCNGAATTEIYTLALHDALPICACLKTIEGHSRSVRSVAFSHDGTRVVSGSDDETVKIWDASSGACLKTLEAHSTCISSIAFSHDDTRVVSGSVDKTVKIWDAGS